MQTSWRKPVATQSPPGFSRRAEELRSSIRGMDVSELAARTHSVYVFDNKEQGEFHLNFFSENVIGSYPDLKFRLTAGTELADFQQMLLLYYFATSDGTAVANKWVSFADLPGGRMYAQAFQGYSGDEIVKTFGDNLAFFKSACTQANGFSVPLADAAFDFQVLPMVSARFVYWLGDEDFPSSCKILFDATATHFIPIDACAIIGSTLARRIIKNFRKV